MFRVSGLVFRVSGLGFRDVGSSAAEFSEVQFQGFLGSGLRTV